MGSIGSIKDILSVKIKARDDSYTDQFVRIFMTKMYMISALVMGVDFFNDKVSCIVPKTSDLSGDFVHSACWIQGFYIFTEMSTMLDKSGYYGIPSDISKDGRYENGQLCEVSESDDKCREMVRTYFLQYQWMPFLIASLALMHYFPYLVFRIVNTDMISLKSSLKGDQDTNKMVRNYFNYKINSKTKMRIRVALNVVIKIVYICVCVLGFWIIDKLHNGNFQKYGPNWIKWTKHNNTFAHRFGKRNQPKPGNVLLPPMGICEVSEAVEDYRRKTVNRYRFVCEISPNILYQYVFIILWFLIVLSIFVSASGLVINLVGHMITVTCFQCYHDNNPARDIYEVLTFRECEYLEMIRRRNIPLFGEVVRKLQVERVDCKCTSDFDMKDFRNNNLINNRKNKTTLQFKKDFEEFHRKSMRYRENLTHDLNY